MRPTTSTDQLLAIGRDLFDRGLSPGTTGNLSVRQRGGGFRITATNSCLGYLDASSVVAVDGQWRPAAGQRRPSKEASLHQALYRNPAVAAVIHLHSFWASALSCMQAAPELDRYTPYFAMRIGRLPVVPFFRPGDQHGAELVEAAAAGSRAVLLANHGPIVAGADLIEALGLIEEIEQAARTWFLLRGDADVRELAPETVLALRGGR